MAVDCLASYLFELKLENEPAPEPSDVKSINVNADTPEFAQRTDARDNPLRIPD